MFILIDKEHMCVAYKHPIQKVLTDLMHIEFPHLEASIVEQENPCLKWFSDLELKLLYKNITGQKYEMHSREGLEKNLTALFKVIPCSVLNEEEVSKQASSIELRDLNLYAYAPGKNLPVLQTVVRTPKPLTTALNFTPTHYPNAAIQTPPASAPQAQTALASTWVKQPKPAAATQAKINAESSAPKSGSKTGRVWEIAESFYENEQKQGTSMSSLDWKYIRSQIITACEAEGINSSTASVQYGKWKNTKV